MNKIINEDMEYIYNYDLSLWEALRGKSVMITGAYGMLPSYMVYMLIYLNEMDKGYNIRIYAFVRDEKKLRDRFGEYVDRPYFNFIIGDVSDKIEFDDNLDYIIHGASPASSQFYNTNPADVMKPNVIGTYNTLELAKKHNVSGYLLFSSGEIYGRLEKEEIFEDDGGYLNPAAVRSCYGEGKRAAETMCKCWQHQYGVHTRIIRPCHTYGPGMDIINDNRVFSEFVSNIVNNKDIVIKSTGLATRVFCYIADATLGYFYVLLKGGDGEAYNVANKEGRCSIRELAKMLCDLYPEKMLSAVYEKHDKDYMENPHELHPVYNTDKLEGLGWKAGFSIKDGFKRTIESFMQ